MGNAQPTELATPVSSPLLNDLAMHPVLGKVRYKVTEMGWSPGAQVEQTLSLMSRRVAEDAGNPQFQQWAQYVAPGGEGSDPDQVVQDAYYHTANSIQFARDEEIGKAAGIEGVDGEDITEVIIRPIDMAYAIGNGGAVGDCDDFSMYLAALLTAHGIPCTFVTVAADGRAPDQFSHVYVAAYLPSGRIVLDASHGDFPGWEYGNPYGMYKEWPAGGGTDSWLTTIVGGVLGGAGFIALWWTLKRLGVSL